MQDLASFYSNEIKKYGAELSRIKKQLFASSMIRWWCSVWRDSGFIWFSEMSNGYWRFYY